MDIDPKFLDDNPIKWITDHQKTSVDFDFASFDKVFVEKIDLIARINLNDFVNNIQLINTEYLKTLRCKLIQMCAHFAPQNGIPIKKTAARRIAENIYYLIQMIVNKKTLNNEILATIWNISTERHLAKSQYSNTYMDLYEDPIEHFHLLIEESNYIYENKIKELTESNNKLLNIVKVLESKLNLIENKVEQIYIKVDGTIIHNSKLSKLSSKSTVGNTPITTAPKKSFSNLFSTKVPPSPSPAVTNSAADKRKRSHESSGSASNQNEHKSKANTKVAQRNDNGSSPSNKQPRLHTFNSFDPYAESVPFSQSDQELGWKKRVKKNKKIIKLSTLIIIKIKMNPRLDQEEATTGSSQLALVVMMNLSSLSVNSEYI